MASLTADDFKATFDAFNRHDIDGVMRCFADDCVFYTVGGADVHGTKIEGKDAIAKAFASVWQGMSDAQWRQRGHFVAGDRAVSEWTFVGTRADGKRIEADGCDLFRIRDGKIVEKHAFRKDRPLQEAR